MNLLIPTAALLSAAVAAPLHAGDVRLENERLLWHVGLNDASAGRWVAVSAEGAIYATSSTTLFAVNPDGTIQWTLPNAGAGEPIGLGADGTIYTGAPGTIQTDDLIAVSPDGEVQWTLHLPEILVAGPSVGPDGDIYGAVNQISAAFGAFAVSPEGDVLWTNPGDPPITSSNDDWPVAFIDGHAIMGIVTSASQGSVIWSFDLDGEQSWFGLDLSHEVYGKPTPHPGGFIVTRSHVSGLEATGPEGELIWQSSAPQQGFNGPPPTVAPDGTIYYVDGGDVWALNADGSTLYYNETFVGGFNSTLTVSPDKSLVLVGGYSIGNSGRVLAYDAATGEPAWQVDIPQQSGANVFVTSVRFAFSPDGETAYLTTEVGGGEDEARLYAIDIGDEALTPDLDGDGEVGVSDLLQLLGTWGDCDACEEDLDGDDTVGIGDLLKLLSAWSA